MGLRSIPRLVLITDPAFSDERILAVVEQCAAALPRGAFAVHLRDKGRPAADIMRLALALRHLTARAGAKLAVHRHFEIAVEASADTIHLGRDDLPVGDARRRLLALGRTLSISIAAHSDAQLEAAKGDGADSALVSPIFDTAPPRLGFEAGVAERPSKPARGLLALESARRVAGPTFPLHALGGITAANAADCIRAGASGVAVLRALLWADDCAAVARAIHDATLRTC